MQSLPVFSSRFVDGERVRVVGRNTGSVATFAVVLRRDRTSAEARVFRNCRSIGNTKLSDHHACDAFNMSHLSATLPVLVVRDGSSQVLDLFLQRARLRLRRDGAAALVYAVFSPGKNSDGSFTCLSALPPFAASRSRPSQHRRSPLDQPRLCTRYTCAFVHPRTAAPCACTASVRPSVRTYADISSNLPSPCTDAVAERNKNPTRAFSRANCILAQRRQLLVAQKQGRRRVQRASRKARSGRRSAEGARRRIRSAVDMQYLLLVFSFPVVAGHCVKTERQERW